MKNIPYRFALSLLSILTVAGLVTGTAVAASPSTENPQTGSIGLQGTISTAAPTQAATIATPANGATVTSLPVTISGLCPTGLLIKIFDNNVFVGSVTCTGNSYSIPVDLFSGLNELVARDYDSLDQAGPDSNTVNVNFVDAQFAQFGSQISLTSTYGRRGADPGTELDWPLILSGGLGPYAISTDWGDGSAATLQSQAFAGDVTIKHTYATAGIYKVIVRVTDKNGSTAYLQLVAVADGQITQSNGSGSSRTTVTKTIIIWWPTLTAIPLILIAFWLGRRHELYSLRKELENAQKQ